MTNLNSDVVEICSLKKMMNKEAIVPVNTVNTDVASMILPK